MFVIGVASQAQHGKDTLADRLQEKLNNAPNRIGGPIWTRAAFASNVKKVFCETFGVDLEFVEKWKVLLECPPGFDMTVRQSLQFIGDGFRKILPTIWLDLAFRDKTPKIISDVRYVNEFLRVKKEGGLNILVGRPDRLNDDPNGSEAQIRPYVEWAIKNLNNFEQIGPALFRLAAIESMGGGTKSAPPEHMDKIDVFVLNNGTKDDFYKIIDEQLVPFVQQFVFEFPTEEPKESHCLIST